VDRDDLLEAGAVGLIDAADRFDPRRNVRFHTYALPRIRGAMIDALRAEDWLPRSVRAELARVAEARAELEQESGRHASMPAISRRIGLHERKAARLVRFSANCIFHSLDDLLHGTLEDESQVLNARRDAATQPVQRAELQEEKDRLAAALLRLTGTERLVISLYYYEQLGLREIAGMLKVTDSRVCQIHRGALRRLQQFLEPNAVRYAVASA
jgi:RNA polymerase sigma factor for flagellar operon FliA